MVRAATYTNNELTIDGILTVYDNNEASGTTLLENTNLVYDNNNIASATIPSNALRQGHIAYVINTRDPGSNQSDGIQISQLATEYNVTMFTALDTVKVLLDVLEETTLTISTIDA